MMPPDSDLSIAPLHPQEKQRLEALAAYALFGTQPEAQFDEIVSLVAQICGSSSALLSLVGEDLLWFKSRYNYAAESGPRDGSFCSHAILHDDVMIVEDASLDERFNQNPLVTCPSTHVRFYAGAPLLTEDGLPLGVICAIDDQPKSMTSLQVQTLKVLANQVVAQMNLHRSVVRMQQINQNKDKFFAIIAHDLKAAFHGILGFSDVLDTDFDELEDKTKREIASYLNESSHATYKLLENLLEWARLENGAMPYRPKQLQLDSLVEETVAGLQFSAAQKNIRIEIQLQPDIWVHGDRHMLHSLIHNLLGNAIKFTPEYGNIRIYDETQQDKVVISVEDNGMGMTPEQVQRLFKGDHNQSTKGTHGEKGTGLGLLLCQQFVQQHHGSLEVNSSVGRGSTFSFGIPLSAKVLS
ncbi:GAF domain-containing sensor histidine kinase [Alkanindiges illinoisensis]|uniref:GAF domain-containing sensor histidine kinase n=1 Tax=Alkanindiges illinoisensis TaxID=197183 RepID=UPI000689056D|nr:GAF domain-containing sensor histidine kinase [Alkanindiges illinoisensis]